MGGVCCKLLAVEGWAAGLLCEERPGLLRAGHSRFQPDPTHHHRARLSLTAGMRVPQARMCLRNSKMLHRRWGVKEKLVRNNPENKKVRGEIRDSPAAHGEAVLEQVFPCRVYRTLEWSEAGFGEWGRKGIVLMFVFVSQHLNIF